MQEHLITNEDCTQCKYCCKFLASELDTIKLLFTKEDVEYAKELLPSAEFVKTGDVFLLSFLPPAESLTPESSAKPQLYVCPFLDPATGCVLGTRKPFVCGLWPFCVMKHDSGIAITLANDCPAANKKSMKELTAFADDITPFVEKTLRKHPGLHWDFNDDYLIIKKDVDCKK